MDFYHPSSRTPCIDCVKFADEPILNKRKLKLYLGVSSSFCTVWVNDDIPSQHHTEWGPGPKSPCSFLPLKAMKPWQSLIVHFIVFSLPFYRMLYNWAHTICKLLWTIWDSGIEPGSATCKANARPAVLSLRPLNSSFLFNTEYYHFIWRSLSQFIHLIHLLKDTTAVYKL